MSTHLDLDDVASGHPAAQAELAALRARIAELEAQLAERTRERDVARLYCAEVASYVCDPIYDKVENRAGIAADAEAMATGEMTGRYLDIKTQIDARQRAEAERAMRRARRDMFAAAALTGIVASAWIDSPNLRLFVTEARELADLQIAELDRTEKQT